jgi:hypothetical protein
MLQGEQVSPSTGGSGGQKGAAQGGQIPALHAPPLQMWLHEQHALSEQLAPSVMHMPPATQVVFPPVPPLPEMPALPDMPPIPPPPE